MEDHLLEEDRRQSQDRRRAERVRTLLKARLYFNHRLNSYDCVIKNISDTGAKIAIDRNATVPEEFEIEIPARSKTYKAKLRWRDADGIGVEFVDDLSVAEADSSFEKIKADNLKLRQAVLFLTKKLEDLGQDVPKFFY